MSPASIAIAIVRVAILSRGYGAHGAATTRRCVLEENLPDVPHLQGADRVALARTAIEELESELLVLDDGFQHRRLARDLDLVLIDATRPWGHGHLLPRGLLREPRLRSAAGRCHGARRAAIRPAERTGPAASGTRPAGARRPGDRDDASAVELVNADGETAPLDLLRDGPAAGVVRHRQPGGVPPHPDRSAAPTCAPFAFTRPPCLHARGCGRPPRAGRGQLPADCHIVVTQKDLVKLRLSRLDERPLWSLRIRLHVEAGGV